MSNLATIQKVESTALTKGREKLKRLSIELADKSQKDILSGIDSGIEIDLVEIQRNINPENILNHGLMYKYRNQETVFKIILASVIWFVEGFKEGGMMRTSDILKFAYYLQDFKYDSIEDVLLCFQMAEKGILKDAETNKRIERYSSMSIEILERYWKAYLIYKAEIREELKRSEKHANTSGEYRTEEDTTLKKSERQRQFMLDMGQAQRVFKQTERYDFEQKFNQKIEQTLK